MLGTGLLATLTLVSSEGLAQDDFPTAAVGVSVLGIDGWSGSAPPTCSHRRLSS